MNTRRFAPLVLIVVAGLAIFVSGCGPDSAAASPKPERVVENFYQWYLDYPDNQLVDRAYRSSEYLTEAFVRKVDGIIASFDKGGYDPFLCAQDKPANFTVDEAVVSGDTATVIVHEIWNPETEYKWVHDITVNLHKVGAAWKISDIICAQPEAVGAVPETSAALTPEQVVERFYRAEINPLASDAYRSSAYLTEAFVRKVDGIIASFDKGGYDPFLCAQDKPANFTVDEAVVSGDTATVVVHQFWNPDTEYESITDLTVALQRVGERWKMSDVLCEVSGDQVEGWLEFVDETFGFRFRYPEGWTYEEAQLLPPEETPDAEKALRRVLFLQPQSWEGVAPPLHFQVTEGTEEEFGRLHVPATSVEKLKLNGYEVTKEIEEFGSGMAVIRYVFQSPTNESLRIVALDYLSGFPERVAGHGDVVDTLQRLLSTFEFTD